MPLMRSSFLLVAMASHFWVANAFAGSVTLEPVRDNTLFEDADGDTSNGAGPALFAGNNNQNTGRSRRALIAFDLASAIPDRAVVDSVTFTLHVSSVSDLLPRVMTLHRVTSDWGEGESFSTGGTGAQASPGDASWTHAILPDRLWREPGGDFEPAPSASQVVAGSGSYRWTGAGLLTDVADWLQQPSGNFGWLVMGGESGPGTARRFDSREHQDPAYRPMLTVHYSLPRPARLATWGSVKAAYR